MAITNEQDIPVVNLITYEDDRFIESIDVNNADATDYSFTGATATMIADATRPLTTSADMTLTSAGGDIVLTAGNVAIDAVHGLSVGEYEYDFKITVSTKVTTLFKGKITVKANV